MTPITHDIELSLAQAIANVEAIAPGAISRVFSTVNVLASTMRPVNGMCHANHTPGRQPMGGYSGFVYTQKYTNPLSSDSVSSHLKNVIRDVNGHLKKHRPTNQNVGRPLLICPLLSSPQICILSVEGAAKTQVADRLVLTCLMLGQEDSLSSIAVKTIHDLPPEMLGLLRDATSQNGAVNIGNKGKISWIAKILLEIGRPDTYVDGSARIDIDRQYREVVGVRWGDIMVGNGLLNWFVPDQQTKNIIDELLARPEPINEPVDLQFAIGRFKELLDSIFEVVGINWTTEVVLVGGISPRHCSSDFDAYFKLDVTYGYAKASVVYNGPVVGGDSQSLIGEILDFFVADENGSLKTRVFDADEELLTKNCSLFREAVLSGVPAQDLIGALMFYKYYGTEKSMFDWLFGSEEDRALLEEYRSTQY